jgi:hypothetical protein
MFDDETFSIQHSSRRKHNVDCSCPDIRRALPIPKSHIALHRPG